MRVGFAESELASGDFTTVLASTVPMSALALQCKMLLELALSRLQWPRTTSWCRSSSWNLHLSSSCPEISWKEDLETLSDHSSRSWTQLSDWFLSSLLFFTLNPLQPYHPPYQMLHSVLIELALGMQPFHAYQFLVGSPLCQDLFASRDPEASSFVHLNLNGPCFLRHQVVLSLQIDLKTSSGCMDFDLAELSLLWWANRSIWAVLARIVSWL